MTRRIPLPSLVRTPASTAHPFPLQIALRAQQLLQGATFYAAFVDVAVALYRDSRPDALDEIKLSFIHQGMSREAWDESFDCMTKYMEFLPSPVFQSALVEMVSHWDWYVGKLARFIEFARALGPRPHMRPADEKKLPNIGLESFSRQIVLLQAASGGALSFQATHLNQLKEMVRVRNLGVHNQWEITAYYVRTSGRHRSAVGDVRDIEIRELEGWRKILAGIINKSASYFASMYSVAPPFDPYDSEK
jgi:hypothetical protein